MLGDRQQFDMGESHLDQIRDELFGQKVPQRAVIAGRRLQPRSDMHLVNRNRRVGCLPPGALLHPAVILPDMLVRFGDNGGGCRRRFSQARNWVGFQRHRHAAGAENVVFIARARCDPRHKQFPDAGLAVAGASGVGGGPTN